MTIPAALGGMVLLTGVTVTTSTRAETTKESETPTTRKTTKTVKEKHAEDREKTGTAGTVAADNTGTNKRDRAEAEKTADQAKNDKSDVELTAEIRRAVVGDKSLSTNAHNVKIIVQGGRVTLKGPVASKAEQATVTKLAADVVGRGKVTDEMAVAP